jgi:hypothetical protein
MPPFREFSAEVAEDIVKQALELVADFSDDDFKQFRFERFKDFHRTVFLDAVKVMVMAVARDEESHYDIILTEANLSGKSVGEFIQFLVEERSITASDTTLE